jgi:type II secretory pathway component PulM
MMFGLPLGFFVESAVAVLLMLTIGYCVVLNSRLKRLHADRSVLQQMVADLVGATNLANQAIKELKTTAMDADLALSARLEEAERFGIELANHISAGSMLMERIAKITSIARSHPVVVEPVVEETNKVQSALQQLNARARARENAA